MKHLGNAIFFTTALLLPLIVSAGDPPISGPTSAKAPSVTGSPAALIEETSTQVRALLLTENGKNTDAVRAQVQAVLFPRFDFVRMTALAVGKNWRQATDTQKIALEEQFKTLLTRTYFMTVLRYRDAKINVLPNVEIANNGKEATVKSEVMVANAQAPVAINYVLYNTTAGWKVFDVRVEGASLVIVYRNQFNDEVSKGGIDGLIASLRNKNSAPPK